ncbi:MAG: transposase [Chloroflexi bacterium]|nr:transposase [Chloroflexota bacterium]
MQTSFPGLMRTLAVFLANRHQIQTSFLEHVFKPVEVVGFVRNNGSNYSFHLPRQWGSQQVAVADGTHYELYESNLLGEHHIRYGAL